MARSKIRERVAELNVIDDILFQKMAEDIAFCEEMLSTILEQKVKVLKVIPQNSIRNLQGRSVILDALCELGDGTQCNIEVQKASIDNDQKRVRYNASCITANVSNPGIKFENVPNVCVIYISRYDIFKRQKTVYHIDRVIRETEETVENGLTEVYVNASYDDGSDTAKLMELFTNPDSYDHTRFPATSKRKNQFKNTEKGVQEMCDVMQELVDEERAEARVEAREESVKKMAKFLLKGKFALTEEQAIEMATEALS